MPDLSDKVSDERLRAIIDGCEGVQGGPWQLDKFAAYVWAPSEKGGDFPLMDEPGEHGRVVELRGWGYYTGRGHGALGLDPAEAQRRQRLTGEHVARLDPATVASIIAELLAYRTRPTASSMEGWQTMDSAPKDGTQVDLWVIGSDRQAHRYTDCRWEAELNEWDLGDFMESQYSTRPKITHWNPITEPASPIPPEVMK